MFFKTNMNYMRPRPLWERRDEAERVGVGGCGGHCEMRTGNQAYQLISGLSSPHHLRWADGYLWMLQMG